MSQSPTAAADSATTGTLILNYPLFSADECQRIVDQTAHLPAREGAVYGPAGGVVDPRQYAARETFLDPSLDPRVAWVLDALRVALASAARAFHARPFQLIEAPRVLRYEVGGQFGWHRDASVAHAARRRVGGTVQLSAPDAYAGGYLVLDDADPDPRRLMADPDHRRPMSRHQGDVILFAATTLHAVTPVTAGVRRALVFWGY